MGDFLVKRLMERQKAGEASTPVWLSLVALDETNFGIA
jgi:hypothetical protein